MTLKRAFTNYLNESINAIYQDINGKTAERPFIFETDYTRNDGEFIMYDDNGHIVIDDKLNFLKFIPCSVLSIIADRVEIPDIQILDAIIPIEMFVTNDKLEEVMTILSLFQDKMNAKPITLKADYQGQENVIYTVVCSFNLPDDDAFTLFNGINGKLINFQIKANITKDVIFGNDIEYFLTIDNGVTYTKLPKYDTQASKNIAEYSDQKINSQDTTSLPKSSIWTLTTNAIVKKGSPLEDLILLTDLPINLFDENYFDNCYLKTEYVFKESILPNKNIDFNNTSTSYTISNKPISATIVINDIYSNLSSFTGTVLLTNTKNSFGYQFSNIENEDGNLETTVKFGIISETGFNSLITILHYINGNKVNEYTSISTFDIFIVEGLNLKIKETNFNSVIFRIVNVDATISEETILAIVKYSNTYIKPILITSMSYDSAYGDFVSLSLEIKERMTL